MKLFSIKVCNVYKGTFLPSTLLKEPRIGTIEQNKKCLLKKDEAKAIKELWLMKGQ